MLLTKKSSLKSYLQSELEREGGQWLSFSLKSYLVQLLCSYVPSDQLFEKKEGESRSYEQSLADIYQKSQNSKPQEKLYLFKKMGDFSLYLSGFFRSHVQKKIVHISYYEQMGQSAYHFVGEAYGSKSNVFKELAREFKRLTQVLFSIQKKTQRRGEDSKYLLKIFRKPTALDEKLFPPGTKDFTNKH